MRVRFMALMILLNRRLGDFIEQTLDDGVRRHAFRLGLEIGGDAMS